MFAFILSLFSRRPTVDQAISGIQTAVNVLAAAQAAHLDIHAVQTEAVNVATAAASAALAEAQRAAGIQVKLAALIS